MDMDNIVIAYSLLDPAGRGIAHNIVNIVKCEKDDSGYLDHVEALKEVFLCKNKNMLILGFNVDTIELEMLNSLSGITKYFVVLSRHSAESGKPSLTTHTPGNPWSRNDVGGRPWEIPPSNPVLMWYTLQELRRYSLENSLQGYEVCYEVTHHGPTSISRPITFIELGSSEKEWNDTKAQKIIALASISAIEKTEHLQPNCVITVGFGGTHYAPIFTRRAFEDNECYGHMVPSYVIKELTLDELRLVARKVIELTPGVRRVVVEKMRREIRSVIEEEARARGLDLIRF